MEINEVNASIAARMFGLNEGTIRRHIRDGTLRARKGHYGWRISLTDLRDRYERRAAPRTRSSSPEFHHRGEAARWLAEHGVSASTARHWPEWRTVTLDQQSVLTLAITLQQRRDPRRTWRLRRCGRNDCLCEGML
jgi:hypothetical protein